MFNIKTMATNEAAAPFRNAWDKRRETSGGVVFTMDDSVGVDETGEIPATRNNEHITERYDTPTQKVY